MSDTTLSGLRRMLGRNFRVYRKTWYVNALPPLAEPALYLVAMGYGLGALINEVNGISYIRFIAPAIIAITMMQTAFMETTYASYVRMVFQRTWEACLATPLSPGDVLWGEIMWAAFRATINATLMTLVVAAFGLLSYPTALLLPFLAILVGMVFAGIGLWISSRVKVIDHFSYSFFLFLTPQFLFAGTFFPLEQLPRAAQVIAYALPLTHATQLARGAALGIWPDTAWLSLAYLVAAALVTPTIAIRSMRKRIIH